MHDNANDPTRTAVGTPDAEDSRNAEEVFEMVSAHRRMMWLFLVKLGMDMAAAMTQEAFPLPDPVGYLILAAAALAAIATAYFVFRLASAIYGAGPGVVCLCLTLLPCFGLFVILILNGYALDRLRKDGVRVGFMGATADQLRQLDPSRNKDPGRAADSPGSSTGVA